MKYRATDTIAGILGCLATKPQDLSGLHLPTIRAKVRHYLDVCDLVSSEQGAIEFYGLNQIVAAIRCRRNANEALEPWEVEACEAYVKALHLQGQRLFYYLLLVCTRESRHANFGWSDGQKFWEKVPKVFKDFWETFEQGNSTSAIKAFKTNAPEMELGEYCTILHGIFQHGHFGGGYGGLPWANIANTLRRFVTGETSLEAMVDTAYTLAHNNGPMFNKGMTYQQYDPSDTQRILDVQRSGQIVEMVFYGKSPVQVNLNLKTMFGKAMLEMPEAFGPYLDWKKVMDLGAVGNYEYEIEQQNKEIGYELSKKMAEQIKANTKGHLEIYPGVNVNIIERATA